MLCNVDESRKHCDQRESPQGHMLDDFIGMKWPQRQIRGGGRQIGGYQGLGGGAGLGETADWLFPWGRWERSQPTGEGFTTLRLR